MTNDGLSVYYEQARGKTVFGIAATPYLWIDDMQHDQYRPALPFDMLLVTIHVVLVSFSFVTSQITNDGLSVYY
jgi:hypothetical protein